MLYYLFLMNGEISLLFSTITTFMIYPVRNIFSNGAYIFVGSFFIILLFFIEDSSAQMRGPSPRRYTLYGSIELNYEQLWREDYPTSSEFGQDYRLGFKGFVIDPRLINFDTSGTLTHITNNTGSESTLKGISLNVNLLEVSPLRWRGIRRYIPSPLRLRYSNYSNDYDSTHYGVGLVYSIPGRLLKGKREDDKKKATTGLPFPTIYFDYDKYDSESKGYKNITDLYSLRAVLGERTYNYAFHYEHLDQKGITAFDRSTITLRSQHSFFKKETRRRTDFNNFLEMQKINEKDQLFLRSDLRWHKPINKDTLSFSGGIDYSHSSGGEEESESYMTSTSGSYTKVFSPRTINTTSLSLAYGQTEDSIIHFERLNNSITADLSRLFKSSGGIFLGNTDKGSEYGINALLFTKTRISTSAGYSFTSTSYEDGKRQTHTFTLSALGPLRDNINFNTSSSYAIQDVSDTLGPYSEDAFRYSANLLWRIQKTTISFSGNYAQTTKHNGEKVETRLISLSNYFSRILSRRAFLNVYSTWTKELDNGRAFLEVRPILQWRAREISLDVEYNYRRTISDITTLIEHKIFVRVVRRFFKLL